MAAQDPPESGPTLEDREYSLTRLRRGRLVQTFLAAASLAATLAAPPLLNRLADGASPQDRELLKGLVESTKPLIYMGGGAVTLAGVVAIAFFRREERKLENEIGQLKNPSPRSGPPI